MKGIHMKTTCVVVSLMLSLYGAAQAPVTATQPSSGVNLTPSASQTVSQPAGTSLDVNVSNHVFNASLFPGANIGEKTNNAIAAAMTAYGGGIVEIPAGTFSLATRITVPQGITLRGSNEGTQLNWGGSGAAIVLANVPAGTPHDVQGYLESITINGARRAGQIGIYQGGDPTNVNAPSTNIGYNYTIRNVSVYAMDKGIYWGNGVFNVSWYNVLASDNLTFGWYYPSSSTFGGQNNHFYHSHLGGNPSGAWFVDQFPEVTFEMFGMDIEYNGNPSAPGTVIMQGGNYTCVACHVEQYYGPFVSLSGNNGSAVFLGGMWVLASSTGTDPEFVSLDTGRSQFVMSGTEIEVKHTVKEMISQSGRSNLPVIDVRNISLIDRSFYLKKITSLTGAGITWCLPYDNSTGTGPGYCYDGNRYTSAIGTVANNLDVKTLPGNGNFISWNGTGTDGDAAYTNTLNGNSGTAAGFTFRVINGGSLTEVGRIQRNGTFQSTGPVVAPSMTSGTTNTGSCSSVTGYVTFTISGTSFKLATCR